MTSVSTNQVYVGSAVPAKEIRVSNTNLFRVAARELGDATQWTRIAQLNGLTDPWIAGVTTLLIPAAGTSNGGILQA